MCSKLATVKQALEYDNYLTVKMPNMNRQNRVKFDKVHMTRNVYNAGDKDTLRKPAMLLVSVIEQCSVVYTQ